MTDETVPIGERCFRGCRRRAVIIDEFDQRFCAKCYLPTFYRLYPMPRTKPKYDHFNNQIAVAHG